MSRAMIQERPGVPLRLVEREPQRPGPGEVSVRVSACGVCRTDVHVADGDLEPTRYPVVPGHEIVGVVEACGPGVVGLASGTRVGIPWLARTCGVCSYCVSHRENLCDDPEFTGCTRDGGYADHCIADARFCFPLPEDVPAVRLAPLLCAGLIGYRSWRMAGPARRLGLYGFGAAAHILCQVARAEGQEVFAFTRPGDADGQRFARDVGAVWAGDSTATPPKPLDAAILFAPVGALVPEALRAVRKGGVVVCGGIHMSDIPSFPYRLLWEERVVRSVANLTRADGREFFEVVAGLDLDIHVTTYPLEEAQRALDDLRNGRITGVAVLDVKAGR